MKSKSIFINANLTSNIKDFDIHLNKLLEEEKIVVHDIKMAYIPADIEHSINAGVLYTIFYSEDKEYSYIEKKLNIKK